MNSVYTFFRSAFGAQKKSRLYGLGYGVSLAALKWYPIPALLDKIHFPSWGIYIAAACIALWLLKVNKLFVKELPIVGWTAIGYAASCIILVSLRWQTSCRST